MQHLSNRELFFRHVAQTSPFPVALEISKAKGIYLYDTNGKPYIDLISGIGVSSLGHCHPAVVDAVKNQAEQFMHLMVYGEYIHAPQAQLAKALTDLLPPSLNSVYLVNSGAEAAEGAMKLAKRYTGRTKIIAAHNAYHGSTHGALSIMGSEVYKTNYRPLLPNIEFIEFNKIDELHKLDDTTACVIVETIQGEAGAVVPSAEYLQALRARCSELGALLVFDEIQCGVGRTGKFFAFEHFNVVPDILLLAKGLGGGMPIGAFIANNQIMSSLMHNPILGHITTFGGHPVCAAAALATINTIVAEKLIDRVGDKEQLFRQLLLHQAIKGVYGKGLILSIEFESNALLMKVLERCFANGVLSDWFLFNDKRMRIAPPLVITCDEIISACGLVLQSINEAL